MHRLVAAPAAVVMLAATLVLVSGGSATAQVTSAEPSLEKSGEVVSGPNTGTTSTATVGDEIEWKLRYQDADLLGDGSITDVLPAGTEFVPGSLEVPAGWEGAFSIDGGIGYSTAEPTTGVNALQVTFGITDESDLTSRSEPLTPRYEPSTDVIVGGVTNGDGYRITPVMSMTFHVFHHTAARLYCLDKSTDNSCYAPTDGYYFTRVPGVTPPSTDTGGDPLVAVGSRSPVSYDSPTKTMWVAGTGAELGGIDPDPTDNLGSLVGDAGFACLDISTNPPVSCSPAWVPIGKTMTTASELTPFPGNYFPSFNMVDYDPELRRAYAVDEDLQIWCLDMATGSLCNGWTNTVNNFPLTPVNLEVGINQGIAQVMPGTTNLIVSGHSTRFGGTDEATCVDTTTGARCAGWPADPVTLPGDTPENRAVAHPFPILGPDLVTVDGACFFQGDYGPSNDNIVAGSLTVSCISLADGSAVAAPANFANSLPLNALLSPGGVQTGDWELMPDGKMLIGWWRYPEDAMTCYDFATGDVCTGWSGGINLLGDPPRDLAWEAIYALRVDDLDPECVWSLSHGGIRRAVRPTDASDCTSSTAYLAAAPTPDVCASTDPTWSELRVDGVAPADYETAYLTVKDRNGQIVDGYEYRDVTAEIGSGPVDLSQIPFTGDNEALTFGIAFTAADGTVFEATQPPNLTAVGPPNEVCFRTLVLDDCDVLTISNTATLAFETQGGTLTSSEANHSFDYTSGSSCATAFDFGKAISGGPTQAANGNWLVIYELTVTNNGDLAGTYDLADELEFGSGIDLLSTSITNTTPGTVVVSPTWNGTDDIVIVAGQSAGALETHVFELAAAFAVGEGASVTTADCVLDAGEQGTGLRNTATFSHQDVRLDDAACASATLPEPPTVATTVVPTTVPATPQPEATSGSATLPEPRTAATTVVPTTVPAAPPPEPRTAATTVVPTTVPAAPPPELAFTGVESGRIALYGLAALLGGVALVWAGRRRLNASAPPGPPPTRHR